METKEKTPKTEPETPVFLPSATNRLRFVISDLRDALMVHTGGAEGIVILDLIREANLLMIRVKNAADAITGGDA